MLRKICYSKITLICTILVPVIIALVACTGGQAPSTTPTPAQPSAPAKTIKIGALGAMTGAAADLGPKAKNAIALKLEQVNNKVGGNPVELVFRDEGGGDASFAMAAVKQMVEMDKVDIIVGPMNTAMTLAVAPYLSGVQKIALPYMPTAGEIATLKGIFKGWVFPIIGEGFQLTRPFGEYAYKQLGYRNVATVGSDFVGGKRFIGGFVDGFTASGGKVTQQQWVPYGTSPDMAPYLSALKDADAAVVFLIPIDQIRFMKQYGEVGLYKKMPMLMPRGIQIDDVTLQQLGDMTIGVVAEQDYVNRLDTPANKSFVTAFQAKYGYNPGPNEEHPYAAMSLALAGIEAARGDTTPETLRKAILGLKIDLPAGTSSFTPSGFGVLDTYVVTVKKIDGKLVWDFVTKFPATRPVGE